MQETTHFCIGCELVHPMESYRWKKQGSKWYCARSVNCVGCKKVHANDGFIKSFTDRKSGKVLELCRKWATPKPPSFEKKISNMSPEEVMSGVQYGNEIDPSLKGRNSNNWSEEHAKEVKELAEVLE